MANPVRIVDARWKFNDHGTYQAPMKTSVSNTEHPTEKSLFILVYCSCASLQVQSADIDRIVSTARRHNAQLRITGWLMYSSGIFFQWLEGKRDDVSQLMALIAADSRRHTIVVLSEAEEVRQRLFSTWDMELVSPDEIRSLIFDAISASNESKSIFSLRRLLKEVDTRGIAPLNG